MLRFVIFKRIKNYYSFLKENYSFVLIILIPVQKATGFTLVKKLAKEKNAVFLENFSSSDWNVLHVGFRQ
jgi:hypothetical protein